MDRLVMTGTWLGWNGMEWDGRDGTGRNETGMGMVTGDGEQKRREIARLLRAYF